MHKLMKALTPGLIALLLCGSVARADELYGKIRGTVDDPSGAVIPGARVTVTNTATGVSRSMTTPSSGDFEFVNLLAPAIYDVVIEKDGFRQVRARSH